MKSEVLRRRIILIALVLFSGLFAFQAHANNKNYYLHEDFSVEAVDVVRDTCPYEIDDAGEICCDTTGCGPDFDPGVIRETVAPSGGTGNYVYMWLISRLVFNPDGSQSWTPPEPVRNLDGTLFAGRDYAPGPLNVPTRLRRCVSTEECIDGGYGFFKETDIVTIWVDDCNCEPDSGGEIGEDQSTCLPVFDPNQLNSISPAVPADPGDQIIYRWYFSLVNTPYPNGSWMRIIGANSENYDPPLANRDIFYIREAINPYCPDSPAVSNVVKIIIGGDFSLTENTTDVDCSGNDNGTADVFVSNGNGPFEIEWSNSSTDFRITGLAPGIYDYTVTDAVDCPKTGSVTINEPDPIQIDGLVTNTTCEKGNDGQINVTVEGGTGSYSYSWDQGLPAQEDQSGLSAGIYCVTVTDINNCDASACFEVTEPTGININADIEDADCFGGNEGSITLSITGGTGPFNYDWDNGLPNTPNPTELTAGTYCVTVTDVNGCQAQACVDVDQPTEINITGQVTDADCNGASTGAVQVGVSGGTASYNYAWTDNLSIGPAISNVSAGEYCVTVTDANDCQKEACFTVAEPNVIEINGSTEEVSCPGGSDGSVTINVTGGTGSYDYSWSVANQNGAEITGLSEGEYCVTVTDENGCKAEDCFAIGEPDELEITGVVSDILCSGEKTGAIDITVTGGTPAYNYSWDIPSTDEDPENLAAGTYCVTVTDENDCTLDACFEIEELDALSIQADIQDIDCFGDQNGSINLTVRGGTAAYTYNWDSGLPQSPTQTDLGPGTYCVTVTDVNGCETSDCFEINEATSIQITAQVIDVDCFGESTGSIEVSVVGGTGNYSYAWGNTALPELPEISGLTAGIYCVTVTDENGCEADECFMVNEPDQLELSGQVSPPNCTDAADGSIDISVTGGTPAYTFSWDIPSNDEDPTGLSAGTYCVTVTDENGCFAEDCFTLSDPDKLEISGNVKDVQCPGAEDGEIDLTITGGTPGYLVEWEDGPNAEDRTGLFAGTYCVTVIDNNGCTANSCFEVNEPDEIKINGTATEVSCYGEEDGSIVLNVSGGTPAYSYNWDNNLDNSDVQTDLAVGIYCVTVTDANGCVADTCLEVVGPDEIEINGDVNDLNCQESKDGSIDLTVLGGIPPYFYDWDNNLSSDEDQDNLPAGTYCVTVFDANNCEAEACFTINEPDELLIDGDVENADCAGASTGSITVNVSGGTPSYMYVWDNNLPSTADQDNLEPGTYCVTVTDENGCSDKACFEVEAPEELIISGMAMDVLCAGDDNGMIDLTIFGGTAPYNFNWSGTLDDTEDQFNLEGGTYCVTVTDFNGCADEACFEIQENDQLRISASIEDVDCFGESTGSIDLTVTGGTVDWYIFQWDNGLSPTEDQNNLNAGVYCVTVTDDNGCVVEDCFQIMEPHPIDIVGHVKNISCPGENDGSISVLVSGGSPDYSYEWSNGATIESIDNLEPGTYCITVTDENDCEATKCFEIEEPEELELTAIVENVDCFNEKNGSIDLTVTGGETPYQFRWDNFLPPTEDQDNLQPGTYCVTVTDQNGCTIEGCYTITEPSSIGLTAQVVDVKCGGDNDGFIDLTVIGGVEPFRFEWNTGDLTEDLSNLAGGIYCVTATDANGCTEEACFEINEPDVLVVNGTVEGIDCHGAANGSIDLDVSGGTAPYNYNWDNGLPNTQDQSDLAAGTYCVTVTDANDCTFEDCFEIEDVDPILLSAQITEPDCNGDQTGAIDLTVSGGTPAYIYTWNSGLPATQDQSGLAAGTYCVTVTDANGCTESDCFDINENDPLEVTADITNPKCAGDNNGSIDLTVTGGTVDWYTFQWDSGLPATEDQTGLDEGTYCVTVTDDNGCVVEACYDIEAPDALVVTSSVEDIDCADDENGAINLQVSGGTAPYNYNWDNGLPNTQDQSDLAAGTYCVTVTDANDCTFEDCFEIEDVDPILLSAQITEPDCNGDQTGAIDLTVSGGTPAYIYTWNSGLPATQDQSGLAAGTYCVTITDANGCTESDCFDINENDPLEVTADITNPKCAGDNNGSIDLTVTGGTVDWYTFQWDSGLPATEDQTGLDEGTYCVTVTDDNGCFVEACYDIEAPDALVVTASVEDIDCADDENGAINLQVSGGTAPYNYNWDNGLPNTQDQSDLAAGNYCVTVTDANDCTFEDCFEIEDVDPILLSAQITEPDCNGDQTGAIDLTVSGGTPAYTYSWNSGLPATRDQNGLAAGTYCVTVTDANGCTESDCFDINENDPLEVTADITNPTCAGDNDGSIDLTVTGGTVNLYTFQWDSGLAATEDQTGLAEGTYCVTVTDDNGCVVEACYDIEAPDALVVTASVEDIDCADDENGAINLQVSGGSAPYNYNWDNGLANTQDQSDLAAGNYCVTVTDANDCTFEDCFEIEDVDPILLSAQITEPDCNGDQTGAIDLTVSGGTPAYTYSWNSGLPATQDQSGLGAGTYCATITDQNGCNNDTCFTITEPSSIGLTAQVVDVKCGGDNDGFIDLTVIGGVEPFRFEWNTGDLTEDLSNLAGGIYCVTATDANGCTEEACFEINEPDVLVVNGTVEGIDCHGAANGSIDLDVSGGTAPYNYNWDNGLPNTQDQSDLAAGTYCVTVTDANDCTFEDCFEIEDVDPIILSAQITEPDCHGDQTGAIELTVSGGTPAYIYTWNSGLPATQDQSGLAAGTYCVTITDANGCTESDCFDINENDPLEVTADITNPKCAGDNNGSIDLTVTGGTVDWYTFQWDSGLPATEDQTGLDEGTYCVTVTDDNGCVVEACYDIEAPDALVVTSSVEDIDCADDENGAINLQVSGGTAPYNYNWDNGLPATQDQSGLAAGTYCVTVTDASDCTFEDCFEIEDVDPILLSAQITEPDCNGDQTGTIDLTVSGGAPAYTYSWDSGLPATQDQNGLAAGTYCVTVTDANGCTESDCFDINENDPLEVTADVTNPKCAGDNDGSIDLKITGGTVGLCTYQWDNGLPATEDQTGLTEGTYCVTVTDDNGCVVEACYTLEAPDEIVINGNETNVSCFNGSDGGIILQVSGGNDPYNYNWDNNLPSQANQTELPAGTYCVTVTDENGCDGEACFTIEQPDAIEIIGDIQNALCLGDNSGSIATTVTGGTAPYNYTWSNGLPSIADQNNLEAGTYCVTVTDKNDCEETECFIIEEGEAITLSADLTAPACFDDATGAINLSVNGGEAPYNYNWSNNLPAQQDQNNVEAGTYCVTVTDNQGCQTEDCFTINNPPKLDGKLIFTQPKCGEDNGTATAQVNGGTGSYSYAWNRNDNGTNSVSGLPEGLISVTVTDGNGCELVLSKELEGSDDIDCNAFVVQMVSIRNGQDGIVDVDVSGGSGNYSYNWNLNGSSSTSKQVSGLSAGTYTVEVTDENDCSCISEIILLNPAKVGDFVWNDLNGNGQQDIGEPGIENIEVQLTGSDVNGNAIDLSTTTDTDGSYHFNVKPGTYSIHFEAPLGTIFTKQNNVADDLDSDADTNGDTEVFVLSEGEYNPDIDAGLVQSAKVGDFIWFDTDQDGIQDIGEPGVEGVIVRLIQAGPDGIFGNADDQIVATTVSDINGMYMFNNLNAGDYQLIFDINSIPASSMFTLANIGADDTDSDVIGVNGETDIFTLLSGDNRSDLDAGIKSNCSQLNDGGEIAGDEEGCSPSFDPGLIINISAPGQGQYEYRWYESYINQPFDINSPEWRLIPNANGPSYDPGRITYSTYFVRVAREKDCENTAFVPSNIIFKEVIGCDTECENIIYAGLIGFSEIECDPFDPDEIENIQFPSGGSGVIEYLWMETTDDPPTANSIWMPIPNSNTPNYDPGFVSETTHFMRCARREDCTNYVETNMVVKRVLGDPEAIIENSPGTYCIDEETTFTAKEFQNIHKYEWTFEGADVTSASGSIATVTWTAPGMHTVKLTTTDFFGCSNTSEITIEVSNDPQDCPNLSMQISLSARLNNSDQVELEYEAASEMPSVEFIIERTDKENGSFEQVNSNAEFMTSGIFETFTSMDYSPVYGYNYYRVRMFNEYGTEISSNIAQVLIQEEGQDVFLYPNPVVQDRLTVGSLDYFRAGTTIEILNVEGKILVQETLDSRSYKEYFSTNGWAEGTYFVRISSPGDRPTIIKFLKFNP